MAGGSKVAVYAAIGGNFLISIMKFVASFFTGSAAMLSEGIHSLIDTFNGILLLYGIKRSKKEPDLKHPFGYGKEVYFWSFVVAIFIFALGGGLAIYEGIEHLLHPEPSDTSNRIWNYAVLAGAIVIESGSFYLAFREFRKSYPTGFISSIKKSKDAATFAVMIEDTAAVTGLLIALAGVILSDVTGNPMYDGSASIAIGILLCVVAIFLARETKGLLVGEAAVDEDIDIVNTVIASYEEVKHHGNVRSMHLGPDQVLLAVDVNFWDETTAGRIEEIVKDAEARIQAKAPQFTQIYLEAIDIQDEAEGKG